VANLNEPWAPFYRALISLCQHRPLPPVRSHPEPIFSHVYLDWDALPPTVRVDCLTEVWKIATDTSGMRVLHTTDGKLVTSPLKPFEGSPQEFLAELSEALDSPDGSTDDPERSALLTPLLDELDRYLVFSALLRSASATLADLRTPVEELDAAQRTRALFLGDDIDHTTRASLIATLNGLMSDARDERAALQEQMQAEPQVVLKARCQAEFDHFDRELEQELARAERLARTSTAAPRRRATTRPSTGV
jgi:hypothetical protein